MLQLAMQFLSQRQSLQVVLYIFIYMPVFAALAGGKVALYHPLQAPVGAR
jgi:hypothetical protein